MGRKKKETKAKADISKTAMEINSTLPNVAVSFEKPKIGSLDLNLGRDDLNQLVAKINEVIQKVNE